MHERGLVVDREGSGALRKAELVELASSVGIEGPTTMTKAELVDAIAKASRAR
jgi:hypothetical protein